MARLDLPGLLEEVVYSTNSRSRIRQRSFVGMGTESRVVGGTGSALPAAAKTGRDVLGRGPSRATVAAVGPGSLAGSNIGSGQNGWVGMQPETRDWAVA